VKRGAIEEYLDRLDAELRLNRVPRRRLLAEVEDHLRTSVAESDADAEVEEAERRAVARFGAAATVARAFAVVVAATSARRSTHWLGLAFSSYAAACLLFAFTASSEFADFPQGAPSALALQVAAVAFALSLVRGLRWRRSTNTPEDRIRFLANGAVIGAAALAAGLASETAIALTRPAGVLPWQDLPLVAVAFGLAVGASLAAGLGAAAAAFRTSTLAAVPGAQRVAPASLPTLVDDIGALVPKTRRLVAAVFGRPAFLVSTVAGAAGVGVFVGQVAGRPFAHPASTALPALALAAFEALCVIVGYLTLGRTLGLRRVRADLAPVERASRSHERLEDLANR
jgi:HAAS